MNEEETYLKALRKLERIIISRKGTPEEKDVITKYHNLFVNQFFTPELLKQYPERLKTKSNLFKLIMSV